MLMYIAHLIFKNVHCNTKLGDTVDVADGGGFNLSVATFVLIFSSSPGMMAMA